MSKGPGITIGAVGDINLSGAIEMAMRTHGTCWPYQHVLPILEQSDFLFGNLECVLKPPGCPDYADIPWLVCTMAGTEIARALRDAGFDFLNLATNHVLDAGTAGMFYTQAVLEECGIATGGVGATQEAARSIRTVECGGIKIGVLCYCEDNNYVLSTLGACHAYYAADTVIEDVIKHRDAVDILIVSIHGDLEFADTPSHPRYVASRMIAEAGADILLHHHPHVPQGIELYNGTLIAYSLGNFIFHAHSGPRMKYGSAHTADSFVLSIDVTRDGVSSFKRIPVVIGAPPDERPKPADEASAARLTEYFHTLDGLLDDEALIKKRWRETCFKFLQTQLHKHSIEGDLERLIKQVIPRILLVAENRAVMDEIMAAAKDEWLMQSTLPAVWRRPSSLLEERLARQPLSS